MNIFDAIILGFVQGITEFVPVSSTGHLILTRELFDISSEFALSFDAILQLSTVLAVIVYFVPDLKNISRNKKLLVSILVATIPAFIFGLILESFMESVFRNSLLVAMALVVGSLLMYFAEKSYKINDKNNELTPSLTTSFLIGIFQSLALIPGISRSGASISGGLFLGLNRENATKYSFLLSIPIIAGSGVKKLLDLYFSGGLSGLGLPILAGGLTAFLSGIVAINFLIKFLKNNTLLPFVVYRIILALFILFFIYS